jgi:hypothetical protein
MKREPLVISEDGWRFAYSPLSISLSHHRALHFTFDLLHRGVSQLPEPISVSMIPPSGFAFFNAAGAVLDDSSNQLPQELREAQVRGTSAWCWVAAIESHACLPEVFEESPYSTEQVRCFGLSRTIPSKMKKSPSTSI